MDGRGSARIAGGGISRRTVLKWSGTAGIVAVGATVSQACVPAPRGSEGADANGVVLLPGFSSRIIATAGENVPGTGFEYRVFPDGAATFVDAAVPGGWYMTVNHEIPARGGVTSFRFSPDGNVVDAFSVCSDTAQNCAGGATPWGTWLSCEEWDWGHVWECDPTGATPARRRTALGAFAHEAAAVASDERIYMTEDRGDGGFYRFTPDIPGDLSSGLLEIATGPVGGGVVTWKSVPNPNPTALETLCRRQLADTMAFAGGEGIATLGDTVWFTTKGDERVWQYDIPSSTVTLTYQAGGDSILSGVDNLWIDAASGNLFVAEDGGDMEIVMLRPDNTTVSVIRLPGQDFSEVAGPCFSPDGQRLYFSSQRGPAGPQRLPVGITYEVTGPFDQLLGRPPV